MTATGEQMDKMAEQAWSDLMATVDAKPKHYKETLLDLCEWWEMWMNFAGHKRLGRKFVAYAREHRKQNKEST